jgi:hypothetical protein
MTEPKQDETPKTCWNSKRFLKSMPMLTPEQAEERFEQMDEWLEPLGLQVAKRFRRSTTDRSRG